MTSLLFKARLCTVVETEDIVVPISSQWRVSSGEVAVEHRLC